MTDLSELQGKPVLVTGAAGCIGAWALKILHEGGARPIAYDLSNNRSRLELISPNADQITWEVGDITDYSALLAVLKKHNVGAIIHLSALQVPFCKADPVGSTAVNVMGSTHILEAARELGIKRLTYASSVAAPAMEDNEHLATLYGAHKVCGEQMAAVYWQDWQVPSVGIRPCVVYGPGRDQGMSAAPTTAMLAAFANQSYTVPFSGLVSYVHAEDAAARFVSAISKQRCSAEVFDLNANVVDTQTIIKLCKDRFEGAQVSANGGILPFPAEPNDGQLDEFLQIAPAREFTQGVDDTLAVFSAAQERGALNQETINHLLNKNL